MLRKLCALLSEFLDKFEAVLKARNYKCSSASTCNELCGGNGEYVNQEGDLHGIQNYICSVCTEPFCCGSDYSCGFEVCEHCERAYCTDCGPVYTCEKCNETTCVDCTWIGFCFTCNEFLCIFLWPVRNGTRRIERIAYQCSLVPYVMLHHALTAVQ